MSLRDLIRTELEREVPSLIDKAIAGFAEDVYKQKSYTIDLGTARSWDIISHFRKTFSLTVESIDGTAKIKLNSLSEPEHDLTKMQAFNMEIKRIFIYNTAQAGKTLVLKSGGFVKSIHDVEADIASMQTDISNLESKVATAVKQDLQATAAKQDTMKTALDSIDGKVALQSTLSSLEGKVATAAKQDLQATAAKQDLQATAAKQDTMIADIGTIKDRVEKGATVSPSDTTLHSNDAEKSTTLINQWEKLKTIRVLMNGKYRVYHENYEEYDGHTRVYKDGVAYGQDHGAGATWSAKTDDLWFEIGDLCQLYAKANSQDKTHVRYFRLKGDISIGSVGSNELE